MVMEQVSGSMVHSLRQSGSGDPISAISQYSNIGHEGGVGMAREGSIGLLPDLEKLSLDKGRPLDVEDLDDAGWRSASRDNLIEELGSLGEGASGAVTKARLKGGNTVFALKVGRCGSSCKSAL